MKKVCAVSGREFEITEIDLKFYEKMGVSVPTLCPEERARRRLAFRNERKLYQRKCDATGKNIVSIFSEEKPFPVYAQDYWWSDNWDAKEFGQDFDFNRPFFEQFQELFLKVPQLALNNQKSENSEFTNQAQENKDCYLITCSSYNQSCMHSMWNQNCRDCVDCLYLEKSELCYEIINGKSCYECSFSQNLENCSNCFFCKNCIGCKYCFGCVNLRNKEYYFLNQPCTKEEFFEKLKELQLRKISFLKNTQKHFSDFLLNFPHKFYTGKNNESFSGDYLENNKNSFNSYNCRDCEEINHCRDAWRARNCMDLTETLENDFCLELEGCGWANDLIFSTKIVETDNAKYCSHIYGSSNLFGCVGLRKSKYCILNKQYTREEYEKLVPKIIEHMKKTEEWGEFFPIEISPFAYNETVAQEYFPMTKEEVLARGWEWRDEYQKNYQPQTYQIPDDISDVPDEICQEVLACETCGKNYKIQKAELSFYRKMNLPIPHKCPDCRHMDRMKLRNPRQLFDQKCDKCGVDIQTTFAPNRPEKVYCEKCYLEEVN